MPIDIFKDLEAKLAQFSSLGDIILLGDMNSRTRTLPDFIPDDDRQFVPTLLPMFSDHCPITLCLKVKSQNYNFINSPDRIVWDKTKNAKFCEILSSNENQLKIKNYFTTEVLNTQECSAVLDSAVLFITDILVKTSTVAGILTKKGVKPKKPSFIG